MLIEVSNCQRVWCSCVKPLTCCVRNVTLDKNCFQVVMKLIQKWVLSAL